MINHKKFAACLLAASLAGAALAQQQNPPSNLPQPDLSTNGPQGTVTQQTTHQTNYGNGVQADTTEQFKKTQTYGNDNRMLSAKTKIQTQGPVTTTNAPAYQSTTSSSSVTTTNPQ